MRRGVKGQGYVDVIVNAPKDLPYPILGAGPGNFGSAVGRTYLRPLAEKYINYVATATTSYEYITLSEGSSITGYPQAGVLALWSELGPLGCILYWGLHVYAMIWVVRNVRRKAYTSKYGQIFAESFVPVMGMWIALNFFDDFAFSAFLQGGIWIWAAMVWDPAPPDEEPGTPDSVPVDPAAPRHAFGDVVRPTDLPVR